MDLKNKALIASALTFALAGATQQVQAQNVQCYGIAKAGQNDCASKENQHSCHGHATTDNDPHEYKNVPSKEECEKLGGSLMPGGMHHKMTEQPMSEPQKPTY